MAFDGSTCWGQTAEHSPIAVQLNMPFVPASELYLSFFNESRMSLLYLNAVTEAAGPMKFSLCPYTGQAEQQSRHFMQLFVCLILLRFFGSIFWGGGVSFRLVYGITLLNFAIAESMSTTRSLSMGKFFSGDIVIGCFRSLQKVEQVSVGLPLTIEPQDPQMPIPHEYRCEMPALLSVLI